MATKVEIYTSRHCAYSQRAKDLLRIKGVDFVEHDITNDTFLAEEMRQRSQRREVPGIFVDDAWIGGCSELFDLDERGQLDLLLGLGCPLGATFQTA